MTRVLAMAAAAALAGGLVLSSAAYAAARTASGTASTTASLRVSSFAPFTVVGSRFRPDERIRVGLGASHPLVVRVRATRRGTFVATFRGTSVPRCDGYLVRANGSEGSSAIARGRPLMCASTNPG